MWIASSPDEELRGDVLRFLQLQRTALLQHAKQRRPIDILHGDQLTAVDLDEIEDPAYVGRHHLTRGTDLLPQQFEPSLRLEKIIAERLEPDLDPQLEIERTPDLTHPATPEHLEDLVPVTQYLAGGEKSEPLRQIDSRPLRLGAGGQRLFLGDLVVHCIVSISHRL